MIYLLDTNVCIRIMTNSHPAVSQKYSLVGASQLSICSIVKAELFYGAYKSQRRNANLAAVNHFVSPLISIPFDDFAAETYGQIRALLESLGTPIGPNDMFIAAIAVANNLTLVTHNTREFSRVANLRIEDWEI